MEIRIKTNSHLLYLKFSTQAASILDFKSEKINISAHSLKNLNQDELTQGSSINSDNIQPFLRTIVNVNQVLIIGFSHKNKKRQHKFFFEFLKIFNFF